MTWSLDQVGLDYSQFFLPSSTSALVLAHLTAIFYASRTLHICSVRLSFLCFDIMAFLSAVLHRWCSINPQIHISSKKRRCKR